MGLIDFYKRSPSRGGSSFSSPLSGGGINLSSGSGTASSSREAGFPDRFDLNGTINPVAQSPVGQLTGFNKFVDEASQKGVEGFGALFGTLPARVAETPFSVGDIALKRAGVDVGKSGFGSVLGAAGEAVNRVSNFIPAVMNSKDAQIFKAIGDLPDNTQLTDDVIYRALGIDRGPLGIFAPGFNESAGGGLFGIGSHVKTVAEFKAELAKRRFFTNEDGTQVTPEERLAQLRGGKSTYDFGYAGINDNPLVDMAGRLLLDPTNALFLVPGGAMAKLGLKGAEGLKAIETAGRVLPRARLVEAGAVAARLPRPIMAAEAIARGDMSMGTLKGLGELLKGGTQSLGRLSAATVKQAANPLNYVRAEEGATGLAKVISRGRSFQKSSLALGATNIAANRLTGLVNGALGGNVPVLSWINDFTSDVENDRPLSENSAWMLASAIAFPYGEIARGAGKKVGEQVVQHLGADDFDALVKAAGGKEQLLTHTGGEEGLQDLGYFLHKQILRRKIGGGIIGNILGSKDFVGTAVGSAMDERNLQFLVNLWRKTGRFKNSELLSELKDWGRKQGGHRNSEIDFNPTFDDLMTTWREYQKVAKPVNALRQHGEDVIVGLRDNVLFHEQADAALVRAEQAAEGGMVPLDVIRTIKRDTPALTLLDHYGFWEKLALPDAKPPTLRAVRAKLRRQRETVGIAKSDYFSDVTLGERRAPDALPAPETVFEPRARKITRLRAELDAVSPGAAEPMVFDRDVGLLPPQDARYVYHTTPLRNIDSIRTSGLRTSKDGRVYFGNSPRAVEILAPKGHQPKSLLLRAKRGDDLLDTNVQNVPGQEFAFERDVTPSELEYLDRNGQWHPLDQSIAPENIERAQTIQKALEAELAEENNVAWVRRGEDEKKVGLDPATSRSTQDEAARELGFTDGFPASVDSHSPETRARMRQIEYGVAQRNPAYTIDYTPKDDVIAALRPDDSDFIESLHFRTALGEWLHHEGIFSKASAFYAALFSPTYQGDLYTDAKQALFNEFVPIGVKPKQVQAWLAKLHERVEHSERNFFGLKVQEFRGVQAVPADLLLKDARETLPPEVVAKLGDKGIVNRFDRAASGFYRKAHAGATAGGSLSRALENFYKAQQNLPLSGTRRLVGRTYYPMFRFMLDPRWHVLNAVEAQILASTKDGVFSSRGPLSTMAQRFVGDTSKEMRIVPDMGWQHGKRYAQYAGKVLDKRSLDSAEATLDYIGETAPEFVMLRQAIKREADQQLAAGIIDEVTHAKRLKASNREMGSYLNDFLYRVDKRGPKRAVEKTVDEAANEWLTREEREVMAPLLGELASRNIELWQDVRHMFTGNPDRSRVERVLNSYWLYWPISYQIKATKWLASVMLDGSFGHDNGALLAGKYALWQQQHADRLKKDPGYAAMFDQNPTLWFMAQMLLPITPNDIGVSLSRATRAAGATVQSGVNDVLHTRIGAFTAYKQLQDGAIPAITWITNLGPFYTQDLMNRIGSEPAFQALPLIGGSNKSNGNQPFSLPSRSSTLPQFTLPQVSPAIQ